MTPPLVLRFPPPAHPVSINDVLGRGWRYGSRLLRPWKARTQLELRQGYPRTVEHYGSCPVPIRVRVTLPFRNERTRDPHNYTSTVVKYCVDGITASGMVPDDDQHWVTVDDSKIVVGPDLLAEVRITGVNTSWDLVLHDPDMPAF